MLAVYFICAHESPVAGMLQW